MAEFNLDNIATDLNNKIGKGECVRYPVSKWQSSDKLSWYIVYNDGWKECGATQSVSYNSTATTVTYPLPNGFDTDFVTITTAYVTTSRDNPLVVYDITAANFKTINKAGSAVKISYEAKGY